MLLDALAQSKNSCMGCTACYSTCRHHAIEMMPNREGFFQPEIDVALCSGCGLCEKVCPQLNPQTANYAQPPCYALMASDEVLSVSSSGGVFTVLADYVFAQGGYVCGAAYDSDFLGVSYVMVSGREELHRLRGSKYVYSKPDRILGKVKEKLDEGSLVLFSGTPCHIAGLYGFLGGADVYENLLTVDFLCGGVPSERVYSQYIKEVSQGRELRSVHFRTKEFGWGYQGLSLSFADGTKLMTSYNGTDPYFLGFSKYLFKNPACSKCNYAATPRQGDLSMGDFWQINRLYPELDTKKGVSCLLVNNKKGEALFYGVRSGFPCCKPVPVSFLRRFNRMQVVRKPHLGRERFFYLLEKGVSIKKAVDYSLNWKFDVGITGCWAVPNYGGALTYYALYNVILSLGLEPIMIERRLPESNKATPKSPVFGQNPYPYYHVSRLHDSLEDQRELNLRVTNYILGSDQIWNYRVFPKNSIRSYSMDYVAAWRKRISYAASFGQVAFQGTEEEKEEFRALIEQFDYVSVRELSGVDICEKEFGIKATWVLDPVFLCDRCVYEELMKRAVAAVSGDYVFTYLIWPDKYKYGIEKVAQDLGYGMVNTIGYLHAAGRQTEIRKALLKDWKNTYSDNLTVEHWLFYLANSRLVIADSFHAICFSIIFKKQFVFVQGNIKEEGYGRLKTLLSSLGLLDRIVPTIEDALISEPYKKEIDYNRVYKILDKERERSLSWLKNAIFSEKEADYL